jgi:hypothetical protein
MGDDEPGFRPCETSAGDGRGGAPAKKSLGKEAVQARTGRGWGAVFFMSRDNRPTRGQPNASISQHSQFPGGDRQCHHTSTALPSTTSHWSTAAPDPTKMGFWDTITDIVEAATPWATAEAEAPAEDKVPTLLPKLSSAAYPASPPPIGSSAAPAIRHLVLQWGL